MCVRESESARAREIQLCIDRERGRENENEPWAVVYETVVDHERNVPCLCFLFINGLLNIAHNSPAATQIL